MNCIFKRICEVLPTFLLFQFGWLKDLSNSPEVLLQESQRTASQFEVLWILWERISETNIVMLTSVP